MPRLLIRKGDGVGRDHAVGAGECVVGRDTGAHFILEDHLASRRHFRVAQESGAYFLEDLHSTNGTRLNGRRIERERLSDGDRIQVGSTELEFVQKDMFGGTAPAAPAPVRRRRTRG